MADLLASTTKPDLLAALARLDASGVKAPAPTELYEVALNALRQCQANMHIGNAWHVAADAILQLEQATRGVRVLDEPLPCVECDCTTAISADGTRRTYCSSDQMMRAIADGTAGVTRLDGESLPPEDVDGQGGTK